MSKFDLISGLENPSQAQKQKLKYQIFKVRMGFETVEVCLPFDNASDFEDAAMKAAPKSVSSLERLLTRFGGSIHK